MSARLKKVLENYLKNAGGFWHRADDVGIKINRLLDNSYNKIIRLDYYGHNGSIKNPSIALQKLLVIESGYNLNIVLLCPDWDSFDDEFEQEILDNMMIKDIIE